jgi:hypothetical protein
LIASFNSPSHISLGGRASTDIGNQGGAPELSLQREIWQQNDKVPFVLSESSVGMLASENWASYN